MADFREILNAWIRDASESVHALDICGCKIYICNLIGKRKNRIKSRKILQCTYTRLKREAEYITSMDYVLIWRLFPFRYIHTCIHTYTYIYIFRVYILQPVAIYFFDVLCIREVFHLHTMRNAIKDFSGRETVFTIFSRKLGVKYLVISRYRSHSTPPMNFAETCDYFSWISLAGPSPAVPRSSIVFRPTVNYIRVDK